MTPVPLPPVQPNAPILSSFIFAALDPTAEQLTSMFEIGFSGANTQRFKLGCSFYSPPPGLVDGSVVNGVSSNEREIE